MARLLRSLAGVLYGKYRDFKSEKTLLSLLRYWLFWKRRNINVGSAKNKIEF